MDDLTQPRNAIDIFRLYWAGKGRLSGAYWKYGVAGTLGLYLFAMLGSLMLVPIALKEHQTVLGSPVFAAYLSAVYLLLLAYQVVVWILVWRNAKNVENPIWGYVAKLAVVGSIAYGFVLAFGAI